MNVATILELAADAIGDRVGVGGAADGLRYDEIRRLATAAAATPALSAGDKGVLAYAGAGGVAVPVALFAAAWAGLSYAPLNHRLPPATLAELAGRLDCCAAVGDPEHVQALSGAGAVPEAHAIDEWLAALSKSDAAAVGSPFPDEPERPAVLLFTSGTSAAPKAAVLDHSHLLAYLFNTGDFASADEDEAVLLSVPPFHIAGVMGTLSSIYAGRRIVPLPRFTPEAWLTLAASEQVTHAFVVPTMLARIVAAMDADPSARVPTLRTLSYGGARMPLPVLERALELFPDTGFVNAYGLTETSSTVALLGPDDHRTASSSDDPAVRARLTSVGHPIEGIDVSIADEDGNAVAAGVQGRVRLRGPQVSGAYLDLADDAGQGGWLATGDLGWVDDEGYLFLAGRADDVIIAGGENISPGEIEDALLRHPAVTGAAVVGVPDEEWGEKVAAAVTVNEEVDADELSAWMRTEVGGLKTPKLIVIEEELPMTASGKILRREIRDRLTK